MRARLLLAGAAAALTLGACGTPQPETALNPPTSTSTSTLPAPAIAPVTLTLERHFGTDTIGTQPSAATGLRRPSAPDESWADDGEWSTDDEWVDDGEWSDDGEWVDGGEWSDDGEWSHDGEWADDGEWSTDDEWSVEDEWVDDGEWSDDGEWTDEGVWSDDGEWVDDGEWTDEDGAWIDGELVDSGEPVVPPASNAELDAAIADLQAAWTSAVPGTVATVVVVPSGQRVDTACADDTVPYATSDDAFYCDLDDTIVIGADMLSETERDFGAGGVAFLLAHEYGHNLQFETGVEAVYSDVSKPAELHADCLAGAYLADAYARGTIDAATLDQARAAAYAVGDDDVDHPDHHGTAQERASALETGIAGGECKVYAG